MGHVPVWEEPGWRPLAPLDGEVDADVAVVGLGVAGLEAVAELGRLGARVVGLDGGAVGGGASGRNGGFLLAGLAAFHHRAAAALGRERAAALYRLTLGEIARTAAAVPGAVRLVGSLRVAGDDHEAADCRRQEQAMRRDGLPVERHDGPWGPGLRFPHDGALQPLRRCRTLARRLLAGGARLFEGTPALALAPGAVRTPGGRVRCGRVLVCVDGGLEQVLPELAGRVRTARAQMLATAPTTEAAIDCPVYARWGYDYWQQLPDGRVALGGGRDVGGQAEWSTRAAPSPPVQAYLERLLRERLGVRAPVERRWAGLIAFGPGVLPVLEEVRPGVLATGAYGGTGNVLAALYGRAAAQLAATGEAEHGRLLLGSDGGR